MISNEEAQELHRIIGGIQMDLIAMPGASVKQVRAEVDKPLERALELAALVVADTVEDREPDPTPDTSINVYFTGDEDGPDLFGVVYDDEDGVLEAAHENEVHGWRVPVQPLLDRATRLDGDHDGS